MSSTAEMVKSSWPAAREYRIGAGTSIAEVNVNTRKLMKGVMDSKVYHSVGTVDNAIKPDAAEQEVVNRVDAMQTMKHQILYPDAIMRCDGALCGEDLIRDQDVVDTGYMLTGSGIEDESEFILNDDTEINSMFEAAMDEALKVAVNMETSYADQETGSQSNAFAGNGNEEAGKCACERFCDLPAEVLYRKAMINRVKRFKPVKSSEEEITLDYILKWHIRMRHLDIEEIINTLEYLPHKHPNADAIRAYIKKECGVCAAESNSHWARRASGIVGNDGRIAIDAMFRNMVKSLMPLITDTPLNEQNPRVSRPIDPRIGEAEEEYIRTQLETKDLISEEQKAEGMRAIRVIARTFAPPDVDYVHRVTPAEQLERRISYDGIMPTDIDISDPDLGPALGYLELNGTCIHRAAGHSPLQLTRVNIVCNLIGRLASRIVRVTQDGLHDEYTRMGVLQRNLLKTHWRGIPWYKMHPLHLTDRKKIIQSAIWSELLSMEMASTQMQTLCRMKVLAESTTVFWAGDNVDIVITRHPLTTRIGHVVGRDGYNWAVKYSGGLHTVKTEDIIRRPDEKCSINVPIGAARSQRDRENITMWQGKWYGCGLMTGVNSIVPEDFHDYVPGEVFINGAMKEMNRRAKVSVDLINIIVNSHDNIAMISPASKLCEGGRELSSPLEFGRIVRHSILNCMTLSFNDKVYHGVLVQKTGEVRKMFALWKCTEKYKEDSSGDMIYRHTYRWWTRQRPSITEEKPMMANTELAPIPEGEMRRMDGVDVRPVFALSAESEYVEAISQSQCPVFDIRRYYLQMLRNVAGMILHYKWDSYPSLKLDGLSMGNKCCLQYNHFSIEIDALMLRNWNSLNTEDRYENLNTICCYLGEGEVGLSANEFYLGKTGENGGDGAASLFTAANNALRIDGIHDDIDAKCFQGLNENEEISVPAQLDECISDMVLGIPCEEIAQCEFGCLNVARRQREPDVSSEIGEMQRTKNQFKEAVERSEQAYLDPEDPVVYESLERMWDDIARVAGYYWGSEEMPIQHSKGDLSYDKCMAKIYFGIGSYKILMRGLLDTGAKVGPKIYGRDKHRFKNTAFSVLRERQLQVHSCISPRFLEMLKDAKIIKLRRWKSDLNVHGVGGVVTVKNPYIATLRLVFIDSTTGRPVLSPEFDFVVMDCAGFDFILGIRPLRQLGGVRTEDAEQGYFQMRNCIEDGTFKVIPEVRVSSWVYWPTKESKVQYQDEQRAMSMINKKELQVRATSRKYKVQLPDASGTLIRLALPAAMKNDFVLQASPAICRVPAEAPEVEVVIESMKGARRFPNQVVLHKRSFPSINDDDFDLINGTGVEEELRVEPEDTKGMMGCSEEMASKVRIASKEVENSNLYASKYRQNDVQKPSWTEAKMKEVAAEDRKFYDINKANLSPNSAEWKLAVYKKHVASDEMILATSQIHGWGMEQTKCYLDQIVRAICITRSHRFHGEGHTLSIIKGPPISLEIVDLLKLPEIQRTKIRLSAGAQAKVEGLLLRREAYEETIRLLGGDEHVRLLHRAMWAERKGVVSGRLVYDLRLFNVVCVALFCLSTVPKEVHRHLLGRSYMGYQTHDVKGAFRTIAVSRLLGDLLGIVAGTAIGRALRGLLGMRSLGNSWTQRVYPEFSKISWGKQASKEFASLIASAVEEDRKNGSLLEDKDFQTDKVVYSHNLRLGGA